MADPASLARACSSQQQTHQLRDSNAKCQSLIGTLHHTLQGKTVEVLACCLAHPAPNPTKPQSLRKRVAALPKRSRVACNACNTHASDAHDARAESYDGLWVECEGCHAWLHGCCIGITREGDVPDPLLCAGCMRDLCCEQVPGVARATLIVCPEAIQKQWADEIQRHVEPGKLKVVVYGGQKSSLLSSAHGALPPHALASCVPCRTWAGAAAPPGKRADRAACAPSLAHATCRMRHAAPSRVTKTAASASSTAGSRCTVVARPSQPCSFSPCHQGHAASADVLFLAPSACALCGPVCRHGDNARGPRERGHRAHQL